MVCCVLVAVPLIRVELDDNQTDVQSRPAGSGELLLPKITTDKQY